jgi:leader peptidase (prepilin peptidase)/N-methyltransferase
MSGPYAIVLTAGLGAALGALAPTVVHRYSTPPGTPPRVGCARCGWAYPSGFTGWVRVGGRCAGCRVRHGPGTGWLVVPGAVAFALLTAVRADDPGLPAMLAVAALGVPLAAVDLACLRLPDPLVGAAGLAGAAGLLVAVGSGAPPAGAARALLAGVTLLTGYAALALLPGARLGFGDVKLAGVLGLPLGWIDWRVAVLGALLPHLLGGLVAGVLLLTGRAGRHTELPFGPALLVGALVAALLG